MRLDALYGRAGCGCAVNHAPTAVSIDALTQIWQRVLQRSHISPEDNFFDLGGHDSLADGIFAEIAKVYGRELPSATICYAPTIAALARLLEQPALPRFSPFVQLKAGREKPPIIITPGVGGRASFSKLAKHIRTGHPIYAIQARGVDGMEQPLESVEDMADLYLDAFHKLERQNPSILIGYSFGGLVALEMAHRLSESGKHVTLVLVDTYPHPRYLPTGQRLWLTAKRTKDRFSKMKMKQIRVPAASAPLIVGLERDGTIPPEPSRLSFAQTTMRVKKSDLAALERYRPRFYRGKVRFVRPEANSYLPNEPIAVWKNLATEVEVETVPGDHVGMVETHFERLGAVLSRYVEEVDMKMSER
jgi:acetoacetyl-CoA synthetase